MYFYIVPRHLNLYGEGVESRIPQCGTTIPCILNSASYPAKQEQGLKGTNIYRYQVWNTKEEFKWVRNVWPNIRNYVWIESIIYKN